MNGLTFTFLVVGMSVLIAAISKDRKFVGIELKPETYKIAEERMKQFKKVETIEKFQ